jgi:hypothetical protein
MRTRLTLPPYQDGAKQRRDRYGERLVCVRYRYDETKKQRWKAVELIIEKREWEPPAPRRLEDATVVIQVAAQEREVRRQVKAVSGKWNPKDVVWELPYSQVAVLDPMDRIGSKRDDWKKESHLHIDRTERKHPSPYRWDNSHIDVDGDICIYIAPYISKWEKVV